MTMNQRGLPAGGGEDGHTSDMKKLDELPERLINRYVVVLTVALMTVRGLGVLAFAWSTVVLLGGFVTLLGRLDFWFITLISFAQSARIFGAVADEQYLYLVELLSRPIIGTTKRILNRVRCKKNKESDTTPHCSYEESNEQAHACCSMKDATMTLIKIGLPIPLIIVVLHPVFVLFNIVASFVRLWSKDYGKEANLKPAVVIFYSLAFTQGVLYLLWLILDVGKVLPVKLVAQKYEGTWDTEYIRRYLTDTKFKCLKDLSAVKGRNLITYASGLLDSDYKEDYLCGERILVYFIERRMLPKQDLIRSSRKRIQKLIMMLSWTDEDYKETRLLACKIVAHVAGHISIAQFPGTLESISSLLDLSKRNNILFPCPSTEKRGSDANHPVEIRVDVMVEAQLVQHGLIILENFTFDPNNCIEMCKSEALLIHILSWICSKPFIPVSEQAEWIDILTRSFKVLIKLTSVRGQAAKEVRRKVKYELDPSWIDCYQNHPKIQMLAIQLHTQVFLKRFEQPLEFEINMLHSSIEKQKKTSSISEKKREDFLLTILKIFLSCKDTENQGICSVAAEEVQVKAGEALSMLSAEEKNYEAILKMKRGILKELYNIFDSEIKIEYRAISADIFKRFYEHNVRVVKEPKEVLQKVLDLLLTSMELEKLGYGDVPVYAHASKHPDSMSSKQNYVTRLQAAFLRIICTTHRIGSMKAKDFVDVVGSVSYESGFVGILAELIDRNKRGATAYSLEIIKWAAMIVETMVECKSDLVQEIREKGIVDSLVVVSDIMSGIDSWMIFRRNHERLVIWNRTLADIVNEITKKQPTDQH